MHLPRLILSVLLSSACLSVSGCATTAVKLADSRPVDPGRHYEGFAQYSTPLPHGSKVVVVRDGGMLGSGVKAKVSVDGHPLTGLWSTERVEFYVKPGDHILAVEPVPNLGAPVVEHSFGFHPDQTSYFRVTVAQQYFDISPTTQIQ